MTARQIGKAMGGVSGSAIGERFGHRCCTAPNSRQKAARPAAQISIVATGMSVNCSRLTPDAMLDELTNMVINSFCKGKLNLDGTNRPQFWQINLSCVYIYADPTQDKMYENAFHSNVWVQKLGNGDWLDEHGVVPVTPSQFGALMREHQGMSQ